MYIPHFLYPFIHWWNLNCFHSFAILNNASLNMGVEISVWVPDLNSFGYVSKSGISESCGSSMFNFFWGTTILYNFTFSSVMNNNEWISSHPGLTHYFHSLFSFFCLNNNQSDGKKVISPCRPIFVLSFLFQITLVGVKWYLMILICISLIICDVEHLSRYLLTICMVNTNVYLSHLREMSI